MTGLAWVVVWFAGYVVVGVVVLTALGSPVPVAPDPDDDPDPHDAAVDNLLLGLVVLLWPLAAVGWLVVGALIGLGRWVAWLLRRTGRSMTAHRSTHVGEGAVGVRRYAQVNREEAETLPRRGQRGWTPLVEERRALLLAAAEWWEQQAREMKENA